MHIAEIYKADCANGVGMRVSVFVSGCTIHCKGCFNSQTWDFNYGIPYTDEVEADIIQEVSKPHYDGLTILGGEPFEPANQPDVYRLAKRFREACPDKSLWIYTGNYLDELVKPNHRMHTPQVIDILRLADHVVQGPFVEQLKDVRLAYRGSSNQSIVDVKEWFDANHYPEA